MTTYYGFYKMLTAPTHPAPLCIPEVTQISKWMYRKWHSIHACVNSSFQQPVYSRG